jgi:hypothetical protein
MIKVIDIFAGPGLGGHQNPATADHLKPSHDK